MQTNYAGWRAPGLPLAVALAAVVLNYFSAIVPAAGSASAEPRVLQATLTNGLRLVVVHNALSPVVTTVVNYLVGSDECRPGFPGTAHALEHMMFRGSRDLSAAQLADITAALGGDSNADTQQNVTQYFFTVPAEDLDVVLRIEAIRMQGLVKEEKLWRQERGAIEQEVAQDLSSPEYVFYEKLLEVLMKGTPYEHDALGTRESFDKTTETGLQQFHRTWYAPNNAVLVIAGDVQPSDALDLVKKHFEEIPARKLPPRPEFRFEAVEPDTFEFDTDLSQGTVVIGFRFPGSDSPDYAAAQILADALSSERGILYGLVPKGKALSATFSYQPLPKAGIGYAAASFPAGADSTVLIDQVREILGQVVTNGVPAEMVEAQKRLEIASEQFQRNSVFDLALEWSQAIAIEGRQSPDEDLEAINRVRVEDVNRVARENLDLDHAVVAILRPQASGSPVSPSSAVASKKESFTPTETKDVKLPAWAERAVKRLEVPRSRLEPVVTQLTNGLKLIIQPESISDTVSVYGRIKTEPRIQTPAGKEGLDIVLSELLSYGTKSLDRVAFQKALDDIGAIESAGTNFSLQVLTPQFEQGVKLLADNLLTPALPEEAFKTSLPQLTAAVAGELESPNYLAGRALQMALVPKSDPTLRETTPESMKSLTIQDVQDYHREIFRPELTTIVVIGKVTPEKAEAVIQKYFGDWKSSGPKPVVRLPPVPPNSRVTTRVPDSSRVQDKVILAAGLGLTRTNPDYYALELGNHVLGGAFYATRLYRDLRENAGLVYYVASTFEVSGSRSTYEVDYACDSPNVPRARAIVVSNLKDMQAKDVSDHELHQAKVLLLREIPLAESSVERIAKGWLSRSLLDLPLDEPTRAAQRYLSLTAEDVRAAFARWLRPDELVEITQGPMTGK
jgi:zinc protease